MNKILYFKWKQPQVNQLDPSHIFNRYFFINRRRIKKHFETQIGERSLALIFKHIKFCSATEMILFLSMPGHFWVRIVPVPSNKMTKKKQTNQNARSFTIQSIISVAGKYFETKIKITQDFAFCSFHSPEMNIKSTRNIEFSIVLNIIIMTQQN